MKARTIHVHFNEEKITILFTIIGAVKSSERRYIKHILVVF